MATELRVNNPNFTNEVKANMARLIARIEAFFKLNQGPYIMIPQLLNLLSEMKIVEDSTLNAPLITTNRATKTIKINPTKLKEEKVDAEQLIIIEMLMLFNPSEDIRPIVIGNAASIAQRIAPNDIEGTKDGEILPILYEKEQVLAQVLSSVLGNEVVIALCFEDNRDLLRDTLIGMDFDPQAFKNFMDEVKYMYEDRGPAKPDLFNELQERLIEAFKKGEHTKDQATTLGASLSGQSPKDKFEKDKFGFNLVESENIKDKTA